ncbi:uncharacterized protein BO97DRAFT_443038 [Aspergillus homomorphus CBS 101889]|uniref:Zn(2)-C6 fungal-type domain-containing protein n=1 Tax=Aspergillus homomorphus (strain CBS 101889) TaxID=1450537 RepID=A0A395HX74_ASPHC|nr:hypothetical protein BO97DRAFT_443038 [Aspergillus homomorphus CBS 101889]RAL12397.1 hypothetical protein BO97DRAFT_443038 [Aspergillus homomorphus CBS 101889]
MVTYTSKAASVCLTCKARKKGCDKSLPRCRSCVDRNLVCRYRSATLSPTHRSVPNSHADQSHRRSAIELPARDRTSAPTHNLASSPPHPHLLKAVPARAIDPTLCGQAQEILQATGLYLDEISVRYFQGIHTFVPIVSRRRFHARLLSFGADPQPDFALLLLCMGLLTHWVDSPDHSNPQRNLRAEDKAHYVATKSLLAQAQALCAPTTHLIQAGVLLAVYEYAHGHPEQAFVTIGSCARMAYAAQLRSQPSPTSAAHPQTDRIAAEEEISTWWGIRICERTFLCELAILEQPLGSVMPSSEVVLPLEPSVLDQGAPAAAAASRPAIQALSEAPQVGGFGRAAQAAWLLDRVLQGLSITDPARKRAHLADCDRTLQSFLGIVMRQHGGDWRVFCGAIALTIRALFLLHRHLLDQRASDSPDDYTPADGSQSTLHTITKMVIDIAATHEYLTISQIDHLPPSCVYIMREASRHIHNSGSATPDPQLHRSLKQFEARWRPWAPPLAW